MGNVESITANVSQTRRGIRPNEESQQVVDRLSTKSSDDELEFSDCREGDIVGANNVGEGSEDEYIRQENKFLMADQNDSSSEGEDGGSVSALDRLLMQQRRERMLELEAIQEKNRRVSDGKNLRRLERFFTGMQGTDDQSETASVSSENNDSSNNSADQRSVVLEVRGLFQAQPVTSVLQSNNFRSQLENIIRGNLVRQERELETVLRLRNAGLPGDTVSGRPLTDAFVPQHLHEEASNISSSTHSSGNIHPAWAAQPHGIPPPPPPPPPGMINQYMPIPTQYQPYPLQYPQPDYRAPYQYPGMPIPQVPTPPTGVWQPNLNSVAASQPPWLLNRTDSNLAGQDIQQIHRENIIQDISNLVQSQMVTSTLQSNFRGQLEVMYQNRVSEVQADGEQIMNFVQNLPRSNNFIRNDFSHLGISPSMPMGVRPGQEPQMNSGAWSHEMASLRDQMTELQNMVKISFDLQLDLQRAIRQEVAAALHNANGGGTSAATAAPGSEVHPAREGHCIICLEKSIDSVLYQCGHMCVCLACGLRLKDLGSHCPMCRAPIRDVIRAFKCHEK